MTKPPDPAGAPGPGPKPGLVLAACCLAHIAHDGLTDMLYVFFPVWQAIFSLSYAQVGLYKTLFSGSLAALQVPAGMLGDRAGIRRTLGAGTLFTCLALLAASLADGPLVLAVLLAFAGIGASAQHPLCSSAISQVYSGKGSRNALSAYNFSGDLGKLAFPALGALLIASYQWRSAIALLSLVSLVLGAAVFALLFSQSFAAAPRGRGDAASTSAARAPLGGAFASLTAIGVIDSATRMGFLTFLPFVLQAKGADMPGLGLALGLIFAGGAAGKLVCGLLASRVGILRSVIVTELFTAFGIAGMALTPLWTALALAPLVGLFLNGTSSVLYGSVPELVTLEQRNRAFALFYTGTIGSGAVSPVCFGLIGDALGIGTSVLFVAALALLALPLTLPLKGKLAA